MNSLRIAVLASFISIANLALAGEPTQIFGKWKFQGPQATVVWEFTASTVTFTPFDPSGKALEAPNKASISYKELSKNSWGVNFKTIDGKPGGGFMAIVKDGNTVLLDFPGVGAQLLRRE